MAYNEDYFKQSKLVAECLNTIDDDGLFALKGGTAINYFNNNCPRLSVDIDLTYLPIHDRNNSIQAINEGLKVMKGNIEQIGYRAIIHENGNDHFSKLIVYDDNTSIKIEPNYNLRGTVYPTEIKDMVEEAENIFDISSTNRTLDYRELYAGKMNAFLDRQHPRDIFDMGVFLKAGHSMNEIIDATILYIAQGNRMISHLLEPHSKNIIDVFSDQFLGMTSYEVDYYEMLATRSKVIGEFKNSLTKEHGNFLISVMENNPKWDLLPFQGIENLPGIQWKLQNVDKMPEPSRIKEIDDLKRFFDKEKDIEFDREL